MPPIQKQRAAIQFSGGIDTKTDPLAVPAGSLLEAKNVQFTRKGAIDKRYGFDVLGTNIEGGGTLGTADAISSFNSELCLFSDDHIYSRVSATGNWLDRGSAVSVIARNKQIIRNDAQQLNPDSVVASGVELYTWEDTDGGIRYSVLDNLTKTFCVADQTVYEFGVKPRSVYFDGAFWILYSDGTNNISARSVNPLNPTRISNVSSLITDGYGDFAFDAAVVGDALFIGYLANGNEVRIDRIAADLTSSTVEVSAHAFDGYGAGFCIDLVGDHANDIWCSWGNGEQVLTSRFSNTLVPLLAPTVVESSGPICLTGIESEPGVLTLTHELDASLPSNHLIRVNTITNLGSVAHQSELRSVGLACKAFTANDQFYVGVAFESTLQSTYFVVKLGSDPMPIIARIASTTGGGLRTNHMLARTNPVPRGIQWANLVKGKTKSEAGLLFSLLGVNSTVLDFEDSNRFLSVVQSNNLLFVGGILSSYDGVSTVEQNFHVYPEDFSAVPGGSDGSLSAGQYGYVCLYRWTDNLGQIQYSTDSVPLLVTVLATNHVTLTIPTLRLTAKQSSRQNVSIEIYRTEADGTEYHLITSTIAPLENRTDQDTVVFVDTAGDQDIESNALLYTFGGVLSNVSPPACSLIALFGGRVFLSGLEDQNLIQYSKNKFESDNANTIPVEFAEELTVGVDARGGAITALAVLDSNLIIFKESAIFVLNGDGPDDTGTNGSFNGPTLVTSDVGCPVPNSISVYPNGIIFKSASGIYSLDRSLQVSYIGARVERYNDHTITSATLNASSNQIIFTTSQTECLVYDYYFDVWFVWTGLAAQDSDISDGQLCLLRPSGKVYRQNSALYTDGSQPIQMSITTPNLNLADLCGASRVFRCYLLGTNKGPHSLMVRVARDMSPIYTEQSTFEASSGIAVWGGESTWGAGDVWGGAYTPYEFRIDMKYQRCTSIRLEISEVQTAPYNQGFSLSAMVFEYGIQPGADRVRATRVIGVK